ncbi:hypothetical protein HYY75_11900 [bacterium]|nr:hypothetical protein [bacterium]
MTEDYADSEWLNDGLSLALFLTVGSTGSLEPLKKFFSAERAYGLGSFSMGIEEMKQTASLASNSSLGLEAQTRVLEMSERLSSPTFLIKDIDDFVQNHPNHFAVADLLLLKFRLMRKTKASPDAIVNLLKDFRDRFPGDIRARRVGILIQEFFKDKGKDTKK